MGIDCGSCEKHFFLGESGDCNSANNSCTCPDGFSGHDDWVITGTCHVNEALLKAIHKVLLVFAIVALLTSVVSLTLLSRRWQGGTTIPNTEPHRSQQSMPYSDQVPQITATQTENPKFTPSQNKRKESETPRRMQRIHELTLLLMVVWVLNSILGVVYESLIVFKGNLFLHDHPATVSFFVAFILMFATEGAAIMLYTWFLTLPMTLIKKHCYILGYETFIVRYPTLGEKLAILMGILGFLMPCVLFIVLPVILQESEFFTTPSKAFAYYSLFNVLLYIFIMSSIANSVLFLFRAGEEALADRASRAREVQKLTRDLERVQRSIKTISRFRNWVVLIAVNSLVYHILWISANGLYQYIFFSLLCGLQYIAISSWSLIIISRTNGGLTPLLQPMSDDS